MSDPARWKSTCRVRRASGCSSATSGTNSPAVREPRRSSSNRNPSAQTTGPASRRSVRMFWGMDVLRDRVDRAVAAEGSPAGSRRRADVGGWRSVNGGDDGAVGTRRGGVPALRLTSTGIGAPLWAREWGRHGRRASVDGLNGARGNQVLYHAAPTSRGDDGPEADVDVVSRELSGAACAWCRASPLGMIWACSWYLNGQSILSSQLNS